MLVTVIICRVNHDTVSVASTASPWAGRVKGDLIGLGLTRYVGPAHSALQLASAGAVCFLQIAYYLSCSDPTSES